ncbi:MAG: alpha-glucosidase C-terminal domain-containing protein [Candidatus Sericytochromatia bacterium]|nr:alpha-glucosidase C-terminal domain-containing protein [Candidatus Sericytochromatia bacterium]
MTHWAYDSFFYHIYPLGFCDAPTNNNFHAPIYHRLIKIYDWIDHFQSMGINALYLGPVFDSDTHGYDTADYYHVDRRLGNRETLAKLIYTLHQRGIRVILDGVFNHVGRNFWAFQDVLKNGRNSLYCDWFEGLKFGQKSPYGDPFTYKAWNGHYNLVKLNLKNYYVKEHLFKAVEMWIRELGIDGLRLDAADCLRLDFLRELADFCKKIKPDFWLKGEIIHGDYRTWANEHTLDSVTNYECYKGLYSSHNDKNYYEIAHSLNKQFGKEKIYGHLPLYNFVDNHDVNRVASILKNQSHLYPLYALLMTMPGIPSIYYGSEWGLKGKRKRNSDHTLRPSLDLNKVDKRNKNKDLVKAISDFSKIRHNHHALRHGKYTELFVNHEQFAFSRQSNNETIIVAVNSSEQSVPLEFNVQVNGKYLVDLLNHGERFKIENGKVRIDKMWSCWARIMLVES